ncbi:hypothetical protein H1C71_040243, partial [Ictidomys tridecemlineatus]
RLAFALIIAALSLFFQVSHCKGLLDPRMLSKPTQVPGEDGNPDLLEHRGASLMATDLLEERLKISLPGEQSHHLGRTFDASVRFLCHKPLLYTFTAWMGAMSQTTLSVAWRIASPVTRLWSLNW